MTYINPEQQRRHKWGEAKLILGCDSPSGCEQTERACTQPGCSVVKITVHPPAGYPWREWRQADSVQMQLSSTPPCLFRLELVKA